jgi:hypothetical protein
MGDRAGSSSPAGKVDLMKDTGGPAFPSVLRGTDGGLSVRDYFAAKAMQGLIVKWSIDKKFVMPAQYETAKMAYEFADVMITERSK